MSDPIPRDPEASSKADARGLDVDLDLERARAALDAHLADPERVRDDRTAAGGLVRTVTIAMGALAVSMIGLAVFVASKYRQALPISIIGAVLFSILALLLFLVDLSLVPRDEPSPPDAALKSYLKAMAIGRVGYVWAALAPSARNETVSAPSLGEVVTGAGQFSMSRPEGVKAYFATFARAGHGQMRNVVLKRVRTLEAREHVAKVEAEMIVNSWPRWVSVLMALGFALFRLLGPVLLLAIVAYFIKRKRHDMTIVKTLIRGSDGAWYVCDADILEGTRQGARPASLDPSRTARA